MFIEYHEALDAMRRALVEALAGRGGSVLVSGGLASGKSSLLQEICHCAAAEGARVLSASGSMAERSLTLGVVEQLASGSLLAKTAERLTRSIASCEVGQEIAAQPSRSGHQSVASCQCTRISRDLGEALLRSSRGRPIVICVDDADFADHWSAQVLVSLVRRMRTARALLVLAVREPAQVTMPIPISELNRPGHQRIRLAPLSLQSVTDLLAKAVDADTAARIAPSCHRLTGGNPLLVSGLLADYHDRDARSHHDRDAVHPPEAPFVAAGYLQAVVESVHRWDRQVLDAARAIAVLDERCAPSLVGRLLGVGALRAAGLLRVLTEAGLVAENRFRHPAAREAVLADMNPHDRAELHRRAAGLLYRSGASATDVARHLIAADGTQRQPVWAVEVLREAAEHALSQADPAYAVRCLDLALACGDAGERLGVATVLARAFEQVNPSATAAHLDSLWAAMNRCELRDRDVLTMARLALWQGDRHRVRQTLDAVTEPNRLLETKTEAELRIAYQWFHGRGWDGGVRTVSEQLDPWLDLARALSTVWHGGSADAVAGARQVLQSYRLGEIAIEVVATSIMVLAHAGQPDQAARWCDRLVDQAEQRGALTWEALLRAVRAEVALIQSEPAVCLAQAEAALHRLPAPDWGVMIAYPLATLLAARTALGAHEAAAQVLAQRIPEAAEDTVWGLRYRYARGRLHLATGGVLAAANDFQTCGRLMQRWGIDGAVLALWRVDLAEAQFRLGRPGVARELLKQQLARSEHDPRTRGLTLRVLAAGSEPGLRPALLREAIDCLQSAGDRLGLITAMADLSEAHERLGNHDEARQVARRLAQERRIAEETSPPRLPDTAQAPVSPAAGRRPVAAPLLSVLTESEQRVAELALFGHTNREIARRLFITVSTVEQHLTRIYRKLKVKRKADLRALLTASATPSRSTPTGPTSHLRHH